MRFNGTLTSWDSERGFGFIEPTQGGQELFVHIKAFNARSGRPAVGQLLTFEVELGPKGKKGAKAVEFLRAPRVSVALRPKAPAQWGFAARLAIPAFVLLYVAVAVAWTVRWQVGAVYGALSLVTWMVYAFDKSAAVAGRWRTSEQMLLLLGLAGGWPGGLIAQQVLRHKSSKASFRAAFWGTVLVNAAGFVLLHSPAAAGLLK